MTTPTSGYSITGGRQDADRLGRQARVMADATSTFLSRVGVRPGWSFLDVGCGTGEVARAVRRVVGAGARVVGCDMDVDALAVARTATAQEGLAIAFEYGDAVHRIPVTGRFDVAYARLVLSHLADPMAMLRNMVGVLRPDGFVAVEDLYTGTLRSDPPATALDDLQQIYCATVRATGGDPTIGPRLPALLTAAGLSDITHTTVDNPMTTPADKVFLVELLDNMREAILRTGAATPADLTRVRAGVQAAAQDPSSTFYQARIHQVSGRRPTEA